MASQPLSASTSTFDMASLGESLPILMSPRDSIRSDDDEIVWSLCGSSVSGSALSHDRDDPGTSDDDYVFLNRTSDSETDAVANVTPAKTLKARPRKRTKNVPSSAVSTPSPAHVNQTLLPPAARQRGKKKGKGKKGNTGLGAPPIVEDAAPEHGAQADALPGIMYEDAVKYMTTFLSDPGPRQQAQPLTLLQALIVELGLCPPPANAPASGPSLPSSIKAAKALLKSKAFLNIREYLAVREQGLSALQNIMHPSRSALAKDIRRKRNYASLKWVKKHGLQVLLVTCY